MTGVGRSCWMTGVGRSCRMTGSREELLDDRSWEEL